MGKYKLLLVILTAFILGVGYFLLKNTPKESEDFQNEQPNKNQQLKKWRTLEEIKSSYTYQTIYSKLNSQGISLLPLEKPRILSQIFPKSKFWQFTDREGDTLYLADGEDKIEHNVVSDEILTDKLVNLITIEEDLDRDGKEELAAFTIVKFQDVALCCDQKRFLGIFKKTEEGNWKLAKENELEVFYGGQHKGEINILKLNSLPVIQLKINGGYYNGLESSLVEWYVWEGKQIKKIWQENLFYDTDNVGTYPKEAMDNYQAYFELEPAKDLEYPKIKLIKTYTKKQGKNLKNAEREETYYLWNKDKGQFVRVVPFIYGKN